LEKIYLIRAYTGKGHGKIILGLVEAYARDVKKKSILLDTMKKGRALAFYKSFGFRVVGEKELPFQNALQEEKGMYLLYKAL
jgi:GNAT superfamily N-acetyltransferase